MTVNTPIAVIAGRGRRRRAAISRCAFADRLRLRSTTPGQGDGAAHQDKGGKKPEASPSKASDAPLPPAEARRAEAPEIPEGTRWRR